MKCENVIEENNMSEPKIATIRFKKDEYESKKIKGTDALIMYLIERVNELEHIVKEQERRIKLFESKNSDGWCSK